MTDKKRLRLQFSCETSIFNVLLTNFEKFDKILDG